MTSLWCHNGKFTRCPKSYFNLHTWQFLKICSIPNSHRNHTEEFCPSDYIEKNKPYQTLQFSDLIFLFLMELYFLCDVSLAF